MRSGEPVPGPEDPVGEEKLEQLRRAREVAVDAEDFERAHLLTREIEAAEAALGVSGPDLRKDGGAVEGGEEHDVVHPVEELGPEVQASDGEHALAHLVDGTAGGRQ